MQTIIYLIRHSEPLDSNKVIKMTKETLLQANEKKPLSIIGEKRAEKWAWNLEFKNLDSVWSSNYVRAIATAKYFADRNNLKINIDERLKEREYGVSSYDELPANFEERQIKDANYKIGNGENQREVQKRMDEALRDIITKNKGKTIAIISHATAITFLLKKWCDIQYPNKYVFKKNFFNGKWNYLETFKLIFDEDNKLIDINQIKAN